MESICHIEVVVEDLTNQHFMADADIGLFRFDSGDNPRLIPCQPVYILDLDGPCMEVWVQLVVGNPHETKRIGYVTRRFVGLAREEHEIGADLVPLHCYMESPRVWRCALVRNL